MCLINNYTAYVIHNAVSYMAPPIGYYTSLPISCVVCTTLQIDKSSVRENVVSHSKKRKKSRFFGF